ncbi:phospholipase D-like domain-containing protein [Streptacidiphilus albus]|uniref:phospholipase D-like domain-containing protein n=1 Tax=Streptacidiphilus albus TaxID=105425 RepID=UPI0007C858B4|nr:phospholipase D-like domain-containing protein [Streptacidiphilus albus]
MSPFRRALTAAAACGTVFAVSLGATQAQAAIRPAVGTDPYSAFAFNLGTSEPVIYSFINSATTTLDMTMYELNDTTAINDLIAREQAGVKVRVILDQAESSTNQTAYNDLSAAGVGVVWSSTAFTYTHQKTITVNGDESLVLSGNLTSEYYPTSRDYGVFDSDQNDVAAIEAVFADDYTHTSITPSDGDNLLWSPTTAQSRLLSIINGATKTLDVQEEEFSDTAVVNAIVADAKRGVAVRMVIENESSAYQSEINEVTAAGGKVTTYTSSTGFYIHAKAIVADYGLSTAAVEVGSMNITSNSLTANRELGIILNDTGVENVVESTFDADFNGTTADTVTVNSIADQTGTVGTAVSLQVGASDSASGQTLSYSATNLPAGLSINAGTGLITGTPTTTGSPTVVVTATDTTGAAAGAAFNWTVNPGSTGGNTVTVTSPGNQTGTVGTAASLQIGASDSASGQTLSYSATNLPAGLSINAGTGLITGTPTTAGTSTVTVTATDTTGATGSAAFTWTVSGAGGSCTAAQLIGNPSFSTGTAAPWSATSGVIADNSKEPPYVGKYDAWLDGYSRATTDTLSQAITIPTGCTNYVLSYWLHIDTARTTTTNAADTLKVQLVNGSGTVLATLDTFSNLNHNTGYAEHTYNLAGYAGQTVTLLFTGVQTSSTETSFVIGEADLNVS